MPLTADQIADLVLLTQNEFVKKGAFVDMQTDLTEHVAVHDLWKKKQRKFDGGLKWEVEYQMDHNHSAKTTSLYATDASSAGDTMVKGEIPIRYINAHYIFDVMEPALQRGGKAIVDLVKTKYTAMMVSFYELMEELIWGSPADSSDKKTPWGINYWVTKNATLGFNGGNPSGFSEGRAGISSTAYPRYRNYTGQYVAVSDNDLIKKMKSAHAKTKFRSPVSHATPDSKNMGNGIYCNYDTLETMETMLNSMNMSLGNDVAGKGDVMFKGSKVRYVPYLDLDSTAPVYMLDWNNFVIGVMSGWESNLSKPYQVPNMHNVRRVDLDVAMNIAGIDPRRQTVFYK